MSDFSDRPLVAGTITGLRSFHIDKYGRLSGVVHKCVFKPGENLARCRADVQDEYRYLRSARPSYPDMGEGETSTDKHRVGQRDCQCGFYAFFEKGKNQWHDGGNVLAVVEGYGLVTVGQRGFRAEKARLLALVSQRRGLRSLGPVGWMLVSAVSLFASALCTTLPLGTPDGLTAGSITAASVYLAIATFLAFVETDLVTRAVSRVPVDTARLYGVPVYRSVRAALKKHPLSPPPPPTPDNDEEFWTRRVA